MKGAARDATVRRVVMTSAMVTLPRMAAPMLSLYDLCAYDEVVGRICHD